MFDVVSKSHRVDFWRWNVIKAIKGLEWAAKFRQIVWFIERA
jgi:hypothetical protein